MSSHFSVNLEIYTGNEVAETYKYKDSAVVISAIQTPTAYSLQQLGGNIEAMQKWMAILRKHFAVQKTTLGEHKQVMERKGTLVTAYFKFGSSKVMSASFDTQTGMVSLTKRPKQTVNFTCFKEWVAFLVRYQQYCSDFLRESA